MSDVTGLLVENSVDAWFAAINRLATNSQERNEMGEQAYDDVRNKYCVDRVSKAWVSCINEIDHDAQAHPGIPLQVVARRGTFKKMRLKINKLRMRVVVAHNMGGVQLVIRSSMQHLLKMALPLRDTGKKIDPQ